MFPNKKVLVIDDEPKILEVVKAYLEKDGYAVATAEDGLSGLTAARLGEHSIIILDLMLPDLSGEEVCRRLREFSAVPILMLTAKAAEEDRVRGLELGADDYLVKPFSPRELVARVRAILRRTQSEGVPADVLSFDDGRLVIDIPRYQAVKDGARVDLTPSEFRLLVALAEHPGRVYTRLTLTGRVQGFDYEGYERTIDAHVKNLRKKLDDEPRRPRYIETVHGVGYRFADLRPASGASDGD